MGLESTSSLLLDWRFIQLHHCAYNKLIDEVQNGIECMLLRTLYYIMFAIRNAHMVHIVDFIRSKMVHTS